MSLWRWLRRLRCRFWPPKPNMIQFLVILPVLIHSRAASFKDTCVDLRNTTIKSTYLDDRCLTVEPTQLLSQAEAQQHCLEKFEHGQLAAHFDQTKLSHIATMIDLSNGVWTSLLLNSNNQTVSLSKQTGQNSSVPNPAWAAGFPDLSKGPGILLRFDGLVNAELDSQHPALCESFGQRVETRFKGGKKSAASEAVLSVSTVSNQHECGISCASDPSCQAYAYSSSLAECRHLWLNRDAVTIDTDADYKLMNRVQTDTDCIGPSDCLPENAAPKLLLVKHFGAVIFESYYPGQSNLNAILFLTQPIKSVTQLQCCSMERFWYQAIGTREMQVGVLLSHYCIPKYPFTAVVPLSYETFIYDPGANTVSAAGSTVEGRHSPGAALLDQAVIMCGGTSTSAGQLSSCERFSSGQWSLMTASLNQGRWAFSMVNLHNKLYAVAGIANCCSFLSAVERFDPATDTWTTLADLPVPRRWESNAVTVFKDQIVVCGGLTAGGATADCHTYSDITEQWSVMAALKTARMELVLAAFHGYIYAFGSGTTDRSVEMYVPQTGQWSDQSDTLQSDFAAAIVV